MEMGFYFYIVCCFLIFFSKASTAIDTISASESLTDGMTLVSNDGSFALGFFFPGSSKSRYLGIWYHNHPMQTVVWVANRITPINDSTGVLKIQRSGKLVLQVQNTTAVWSANWTATVENPVLQLLDSGNLVVRDGKDSNPGRYLWQSFDYPSDTILPGMKIGVDLRSGFQIRLSAWKNWDDPSPADLTYGVELVEGPEMVLRKGSEKLYRSGLWIGNGFSGSQDYRSIPFFVINFVWNENEVYYTFLPKNESVTSRLVLNQTESVRKRYTWNPETQTWNLFSVRPSDYCDTYGVCGPNANCENNKFPFCQCLTGFMPDWSKRSSNSSEYPGGCIRSEPQNCQRGDGFIRIRRVKTPDTTNLWVNKTMNLKECRAQCWRNCSCMAYTNLDVTKGGSGCAMWFGDLIDIRQFQSESDGMDLYIRVPASEIELKKRANVKLAIILATVIASLLGILLVVCYICRIKRKLKAESEGNNVNDKENKDEDEDLELAIFGFAEITKATNTFSFRNKLGQGGFGPVYKGILSNGQEIAVKRLSKSSGQGLNEFKNEVISGRKNRGFYHANGSGNLIEHAWRLWTEDNSSDVVDDFLVETGDLPKMLRCIHISLLCVQQHPEERPDMSSVVLMLGSRNELPSPQQPGFLVYNRPFGADSSSGNDRSSSRNEISLSTLEAR
ncbi:hypothetical protein V6N13_085643 [Hibiscus sabdariffa]|uniref:Non-specific serine/threonine protein kinase n=2 Tax=Hibiscus sabdariffa TaxID=183260 RepID=A0ABR1ZBN9_9ROSI